jgi:NTE family protein
VLLTGSAVFLAYLDVAVVNVALPTVARDLGASITTTSWSITAYTVTFTALLVTAGRIADAHGRRRVYVAGVLLFGLGSALCATAPSLLLLVVFRVVQGVGAAVLVPVSLALLLPLWPVERRGEAIGLWGMCGGVAGAIGPSAGGVLAAIDWRWIFVVNVPVALAVAVAAHRRLDETIASDKVHVDTAGIFLLAAGVGSLVLAVTESPRWGVVSARTAGCLAVVLFAAALLGVLERRAAEPVLDLALFRIRSFSIGTAASALFFFAFLGHGLASVLFLQSVWGYGPARAGLAFAVAPLTAIAANPIGGRLVDRHGSRTVGMAGLAVYVTAMVAFAFLVVGQPPAYLGRFLPIACAASCSLGFIFPALTGASTVDVSGHLLATATGVLNTLRQIGGVIGVAVVVAVLSDFPSDSGPYFRLYIGLAVAAGLAALSVVALRPHTGGTPHTRGRIR